MLKNSLCCKLYIYCIRLLVLFRLYHITYYFLGNVNYLSLVKLLNEHLH